MDKWEFFQDIKGAWRWRRTSANGRSTTASTESYQTRSGAVYDAKTRGYTERPAEEKLDIADTFVNLRALSADASTTEPERDSGRNPYDTIPDNPNRKRDR